LTEPSPPRLWVPELPSPGELVSLPEISARHARVLRLSPGAAVTLFDGAGTHGPARLQAGTRAQTQALLQQRFQSPPPQPALHLILGLPKASKLEMVARMCTELGVAGLHLAQCQRSVPAPAAPRAAAERVARLQRIAFEACAQSGQLYAPTIHAADNLAAVASRAPSNSERLVFWERSETAGPWQGDAAPAPRSTWAVIGPEGGLEAAEVQALCQQGFEVAGLGPSILRFETAAVAAASLLLARLGRLD